MTAPSNANTSGLVNAGHIVWWKAGGVRYYPEGESFGVSKSCCVEPLVTAASAQARIAELEAENESHRSGGWILAEMKRRQEAEARADRLAKDAKGLLAEIASFGRAFMEAQESLESTSTPDAYDDAILAASVRYQSMVKTASVLYRAALQQEKQP